MATKYKAWTDKQDEQLLEMYNKGASYGDMAEKLKRSPSSVSNRLYKIKNPKRPTKSIIDENLNVDAPALKVIKVERHDANLGLLDKYAYEVAAISVLSFCAGAMLGIYV